MRCPAVCYVSLSQCLCWTVGAGGGGSVPHDNVWRTFQRHTYGARTETQTPVPVMFVSHNCVNTVVLTTVANATHNVFVYNCDNSFVSMLRWVMTEEG